MTKEFLLYIFTMLTVTFCYGQDVIIKKDSTRITGKILKINDKELLYETNKTRVTISKTDLHKLLLANGMEIILPTGDQLMNGANKLSFAFRKKVWINSKVGDYIKINIELGAIINESYCNKTYSDYQRLGSLGSPHDVFFSQPGKKYINMGGSTGINFLFGKSPFFKHIVGLNYTNSKSEFNYNEYKSSYDPNNSTVSSYEQVTNYKSSIHYLTITNGFRFVILKRLSIDNCMAINIPVHSKNVLNGYETWEERTYTRRTVNTFYFNNTITNDSKIGLVFSFMPKITYEFFDFNKKVGVYFAYNISYKYNLPWWMVGVTYYPFKKLK